MIKDHLCLVAPNGAVLNVFRAGSQIDIEDGQVEGENTYITFPNNTDKLETIILNFYWEGEWKERPSMNLSVEGNVIKNVPKGTKIFIEDREYFHEDGEELTINFLEGNGGVVFFENFPYVTEAIEIDYQP